MKMDDAESNGTGKILDLPHKRDTLRCGVGGLGDRKKSEPVLYRERLVAATALSKRDDGRVSLIVPDEVWSRGLLTIDPGVHGGYAFTGKDHELYVQPFAKGGSAGAYQLLREKLIPNSVVVVEAVGPSGGMSSAASVARLTD